MSHSFFKCGGWGRKEDPERKRETPGIGLMSLVGTIELHIYMHVYIYAHVFMYMCMYLFHIS